MKLRTKSIRYQLIILIGTELPLTISVSQSMVFAAEAHGVEGHFRRLKPILKTLKSLKFRFGSRRPRVSKRVRQHFKPLKTSDKKGHRAEPSEDLSCVISNN
jgi:hypothetical protein